MHSRPISLSVVLSSLPLLLCNAPCQIDSFSWSMLTLMTSYPVLQPSLLRRFTLTMLTILITYLECVDECFFSSSLYIYMVFLPDAMLYKFSVLFFLVRRVFFFFFVLLHFSHSKVGKIG